MRAPRKSLEDDTPRPKCGCGAPATYLLGLSVRSLELDRDAGVRSKLFWRPSYAIAHTNIETLVCDECVRNKINVTVAVDATVEKAKPVL